MSRTGDPASRPEPPKPAAAFQLFAGLPVEQQASLHATLPVRKFLAGETILREGDFNGHILLVEEGEVAIWKGPPNSPAGVLLRTSRAGDSFGEASVLNGAPVSATLLALTPVTLRAFDPQTIADGAQRERVLTNIARLLASWLTDTSADMLTRHERQLRAMRVQAVASAFATRILVLLSIYMFSLPVFQWVKPFLHSTALYSFVIILMFTLAAWSFLLRASTGLKDYGFTLVDWPRQIGRAVLVTLPLVVAVTLAKAAACAIWPEQFSLFEPWRVIDAPGFDLWIWLFYAGGYAVLTFAQEVVRCAIQGSLAIFYTSSGQPDRGRSLLAANFAFAATHVHLGLIFPMLAFIPGFFWGWLYQRDRSYLGVTVSHLLLGGWVLFVLGVPY